MTVLSPYANFISANFITAIFENIPYIFALCEFWAIYFISAIFGYFLPKNCTNEIKSPKFA